MIKFPLNDPSSTLSPQNNIDHATLEALAHRGSFGIFCEYNGDAENAVATKITNVLNLLSKNVNNTLVRGNAVVYKDGGDITPEDWSYIRCMIKAKRTHVPTESLKEHLKATLASNAQDFDEADMNDAFLHLLEYTKNEIRKFWGDALNE